jgi:hypothetical protein
VRAFLISLMLCLAPLESKAEEIDLSATLLNELCSSTEPRNAESCAAYLTGYLAGIRWGQALTLEATQGQVCVGGPDLNTAESQLALRLFLAQNPDVWEQPAGLALGAGLVKAFPCR